MSLRRRINQNCKACAWDNLAKGTWRQQVTLCAIKSCPFHEVRPKTARAIPSSVLTYYGVSSDEYQHLKEA